MTERGELPGRDKIVAKLNGILEHELAGLVRYTHYSFFKMLRRSGDVAQAIKTEAP